MKISLPPKKKTQRTQKTAEFEQSAILSKKKKKTYCVLRDGMAVLKPVWHEQDISGCTLSHSRLCLDLSRVTDNMTRITS